MNKKNLGSWDCYFCVYRNHNSDEKPCNYCTYFNNKFKSVRIGTLDDNAIMGELTQTAWKEKMTKKTENQKTLWIGTYTPYCCSECGHYSDSKTPYCPYCGSSMNGWDK